MEIVPIEREKDLTDFINFPYSLYAGDAFYAPPLKRELKEQFSSHNPFFRHAEVKFFLAKREKKIVGRIASIVNRRHIEFHKEEVGFFGFFESINDAQVSRALLDAAGGDLRTRGMKMVRGPMNFSTNEECGFLTEGFGEPPMLMTPHNPPYYNELMEEYGMEKAKDLFAYIHQVREQLQEKVLRVAAIAEKRGVRVRPVDKKRFDEEMLVFKEVYNSAWEKNWGFIPLTDEEIFDLGKRLKQIAVPELTLIAEDDGKPVGFLGLLPDFNVVLRRMRGKLNPLTILKALYFSRKISDLRLLLLGIRPEYRNKGVDALLYREGHRGIRNGGYKRLEFSWILEDNVAVQRIVELVGGTLYKKYRIYEKPL
ncbi:MAG TPA: GNAT family N-acetyltransferase [Thermodesulfovibrionales bacterium]|nr:GNAT family N-acetyltransferase [Thermodesulfovibrionales bacterium]